MTLPAAGSFTWSGDHGIMESAYRGAEDERKPTGISDHCDTLVVLGTFLLWFVWYMFNFESSVKILVPYCASGEVTSTASEQHWQDCCHDPACCVFCGFGSVVWAKFYNRALVSGWSCSRDLSLLYVSWYGSEYF